MKEQPKRSRKRKPGPVAEVLKVDLDPTVGLDRLVGKKPSQSSAPNSESTRAKKPRKP